MKSKKAIKFDPSILDVGKLISGDWNKRIKSIKSKHGSMGARQIAQTMMTSPTTWDRQGKRSLA